MYTAITGAEAAAADIHDVDEVEDIELDQASDGGSTVARNMVVRSKQLGTALKE